ncbi:hypothetical protein HO133_005268 [Letharia lupina]|uniref:Uncharacterized protein n=1 Tax=Letharia lupina TaxID=560253 RepID=A0A8H6C8T6_9LECA|nr:uncharacterized protein HO133_005268 [Letharia lupina]KAF6218726.1 hypothetical protein HO133_005268 [Letharia lupina]
MSATTTLHARPSSSALSTNPPLKTPGITMDPDSSSSSPQSTSLRQPSPSPNQRLRPPTRRHTSTIDDLISKPLDIEKHRKMPYFLRMRGSITPRMIVPLVFVAIWSTIITCISQFWYQLVVSSLLLTVLGFVVGLGISFRTSSAYERYVEGRKYWAQLIQTSRDLARHIWIHAEERHDRSPEAGKADLLAKLTALSLINAFAVSLKRRLRFEPYANYDDLAPLVGNLSTFAGAASDAHAVEEPDRTFLKAIGSYLGLEFLESNPRKHIKRADKDGKKLGNLPLEVLHYLSAYVESIIANGTLPNGVHQGMMMANLASLNEVLAGTERVVNTPLPVAYSIAISQITWTYVIALPFQLWDSLRWVTIPGTVVGAYIILGIAAIGREIEDPFGYDENDLPLDRYCKQIEDEINVISSKEPPKPEDFIATEGNRLMYSLSYGAWNAKSTEDIRATLRAKAKTKPMTSFPPVLAEKGAQDVV